MTIPARKGPKQSRERQHVETHIADVKLLRAQGMTRDQIASHLGVRPHHIQTVLQNHKIRAVPKGLPSEVREEVKRRYLSGELPRTIAKMLSLPEKQVRCFVAKNIREKNPNLPKPRLFGQNNPAWTGGKTRFRKGYAYVPNGELDIRGRTKYVPEHRLLMEKHLGRKLLPTETVHHVNGDPADNRIENLMMFSSNGAHLHHELTGRCPKWTEDGKARILAALRARKASVHLHPTNNASVQFGQLTLPL